MMGRAKHCRYCKRALTLHEQYAGGVCSAPACREEVLKAQLVDFRARAAELLGEEAGASIPIAVIPHRTGSIAPLGSEQRSAFELHLRATARRANTATESVRADSDDCADPDGFAPPPKLQTERRIGSAVCSACRGFCCYTGNAQHAYIDSATLQHYAQAHPGNAPDEIVVAYLAHVPDRHFEGSCVYHAADGCALPRAMRSAMCNEYTCKGLKEALAAQVADPRERRFIVARVDNRIVRGVLIDSEASREIFNTPAQTSAAPHDVSA